MTEAERAKEALLEFVRALGRRQARVDFEEEQRARREAQTAVPEKVLNDNVFGD